MFAGTRAIAPPAPTHWADHGRSLVRLTYALSISRSCRVAPPVPLPRSEAGGPRKSLFFLCRKWGILSAALERECMLAKVACGRSIVAELSACGSGVVAQ